MVDSIIHELHLRKGYLKNELIETIYFGGGTPSLLNEGQISAILNQVYKLHYVSDRVEISFEANPDDLDRGYLKTLRKVGINRLSLGIQSFNDKVLRFLNRAHSAEQSTRAIHWARDQGFDNISIDLIYSIPVAYEGLWTSDLRHAVNIKPEHISSYSLTIEPDTVFGRRRAKGDFTEMNEDEASTQFEVLISTLHNAGYEQYEISNFCANGLYSRHNSNYWKQKKYLGVGPSAHSYDGFSRQYNISNNSLYMKQVGLGEVPFERETLKKEDMVNEYILTTLRTKWGCDIDELKRTHNFDLMAVQKEYLEGLLSKGYIKIEGSTLSLKNDGKLLADQIASDLFI